MPNYSIPRRIWRIIYPPLVFILVPVVVMLLAAFIYGAYISASLVSEGFDTQYIIEKSIEFMTANTMLLQLIGFVVCLCIFAPMWKKTSKTTPRYSANKMTVPIIALTIIVGIGLSLLISSIITVSNLTEYFQSYNNFTDFLTESNIFLQILTVVIIGPIVEEFVFRGVVFNRLLYWMPTWAAVIIQGALFGIAHLNPLQGIYTFIVGVGLALLYIRFRNFWVPVIAHIAFNSAGYIVNGFLTAIGVEEINTWFTLIPSVIIFCVCAWLLTKQPVPVAESPITTVPALDAGPSNAS